MSNELEDAISLCLSDQDSVLYSLKTRRGPDTVHYDVAFCEDFIVLRYLGEYWEQFRPRTYLQRRMDLILYSIRKKKSRASTSNYKIIKCSEVKEIKIIKPIQSKHEHDEPQYYMLVIQLNNGYSIEFQFPKKLYKIAKKIIKRACRKPSV